MDSTKLVSFKEFIARTLAYDFDSPEDSDWDNAQNLMTGGKNYVYGSNYDTTSFEEQVFVEAYNNFMKDPDSWLEDNKLDIIECLGEMNELINETNL